MDLAEGCCWRLLLPTSDRDINVTDSYYDNKIKNPVKINFKDIS